MTVRIKKDGQAEVVEADDACKLEAIKILDEMLEDYVGIRDKVSIRAYLERVHPILLELNSSFFVETLVLTSNETTFFLTKDKQQESS